MLHQLVHYDQVVLEQGQGFGDVEPDEVLHADLVHATLPIGLGGQFLGHGDFPNALLGSNIIVDRPIVGTGLALARKMVLTGGPLLPHVLVIGVEVEAVVDVHFFAPTSGPDDSYDL